MASLEVLPYPPAPGGMNRALPPWEIDDTEAQYIQDGLVDKPGLLRRRGPVTPDSKFTALPRKGSHLTLTLDPVGDPQYAALTGTDAAGYLTAWDTGTAAWVDMTWPHALPNDPASGVATAHRHTYARAALGGGEWVGASNVLSPDSPLQGLALWRGGTKANYTTGTVTVARGSAMVTGAGTTWLADVTPGMFLFADTDDGVTKALIGTVQGVNSDTSITLEKVSGYACTGTAYVLQSIRGFAPKVGEGLITCATSSATVNGGNTKFVSQGLGSGVWNLYRRRDLTWIGKVSSVASATQLTLAANAAIAMADEQYVAVRADGDYSIETTASTDKVGFITGVYAERQWFANNGAQLDKTYRLWYSDTDDPELVDLSEDGSWIPISSTGDIQEPIHALGPAYNAMVVLKETEAFAIYGASPATFNVKKLWDDGCLSGGSLQLYGGGVLWAGREGIHFYDGVQVTNLTLDKLGDVWRNSVKSFDTARYRMWSVVARDHYILHIEKLTPTISVIKGTHSSTPDRWTVAINMTTRAVTLLTNVGIRGAVRLPGTELQQTWFLVNDATVAHICAGDTLFDAEGLDTITCIEETAGPDFYFESKKFNEGDPLRLKRYKQLAVYYLVQGGELLIDTVVGLNDIGQTAGSTLPASVYTWTTMSTTIRSWTDLKNTFPTWTAIIQGVYVPKRIRFIKRTQHFSFRIYQSTSSIARLNLGPFEIGFKWMRAGRV